VTFAMQSVLPSASPPHAAISSVRFPLGWLLEHAAPSIQYRAIIDVAALGEPYVDRLAALPFAQPFALRLALAQHGDGSWGKSMLGLPAARGGGVEGVGTIPAFRRLVEYGWHRESPPLLHARRLLFRLLAEDEGAEFLFEFLPKGKPDEELVRRGRAILREAAAAALAHAGYEGDPRLRGAARRILERIGAYLRSPLAQKPWIRVGNKQVLAPEAAPPSIFSLTMLAHMPLFRSEHHEVTERIYQYVAQPLPRQESVQLCGGKIVPQPHLLLGDPLPHRNAADQDVPWALTWLELMARLGFLRQNEGWLKLFDRFLDDRDREGIWHPHKGLAMPRTANPFVWPSFPLEEIHAGDERWTDVTFRLGLIARLTGRRIELM
jgi:hypothetical protein